MVQQLQVILVDDLDGSEAAETVLFSLEGTAYELDLAQKNAKRLREALEPFVGRSFASGGGSRALSA